MNSTSYKASKISGPIPFPEEEYTQQLEEIIKRDYFSDLLKLEAYEQYKEKRDAGIPVKIPSILINPTPAQTPYHDEGLLKFEKKKSSEGINIEKNVGENLPLDQFLTKYTRLNELVKIINPLSICMPQIRNAGKKNLDGFLRMLKKQIDCK